MQVESRHADITGNDSDDKAYAKEARGMEPTESLRRAFLEKFKTVVDWSNVTLAVLDARDPVECRHYVTEKAAVCSH